LLYEMATGQKAFPGTTLGVAIEAVLSHSPIPVSTLNPDVSAQMEAIINKAIAKDKDSRYQSAADLLSDLQMLKRQFESGPATGSLPSVAAAAAPMSPAKRFPWRMVLGSAAVMAMVVTAGWFYRLRSAGKLSVTDTVVLADFTNKTGDAVFDDALRQGLSVQLEQSPFLSVISEQRARQLLPLMGKPLDEKLSPGVAQEICVRTASKAFLSGTISSLGTQYVIGISAVNCLTGDTLAEEQVTADNKERVLSALGAAAVSLRAKLGESLGSVRKFDTPLEQATTSSLEALKAFSLGIRVQGTAGDGAAIPFFERAVELDPTFALSYAQLGIAFTTIGEPSNGARYTGKAYELRERASEPEKYFISAIFHKEVTGDIEKAEQPCKLWIQNYPRNEMPHVYLSGAVYPVVGQYTNAEAAAREALRLRPDSSVAYAFLMFADIALDRFVDAKAAYRRALERKLSSAFYPLALYQIAFLQNDKAAMAQQLTASAGQAGINDELLGSEADTAAYFGRLAAAREFSRQAMDTAERTKETEAAATYAALSGLREALFGNRAEAHQRITVALGRPTGRDVRYAAALALAYMQAVAPAQTLIADLAKTYPEDTIVQFNYLPTLRAKLAVSRGNPAEAILMLKAALPNELGQTTESTYGWNALYPVFVRGEAYLAAHRGDEAASEFQKILDHRGIVLNEPIGALAHLGLARAYVLSGDTGKARAAYEDFLALWKDADPNIPTLIQAKIERAKLR